MICFKNLFKAFIFAVISSQATAHASSSQSFVAGGVGAAYELGTGLALGQLFSTTLFFGGDPLVSDYADLINVGATVEKDLYPYIVPGHQAFLHNFHPLYILNLLSFPGSEHSNLVYLGLKTDEASDWNDAFERGRNLIRDAVRRSNAFLSGIRLFARVFGIYIPYFYKPAGQAPAEQPGALVPAAAPQTGAPPQLPVAMADLMNKIDMLENRIKTLAPSLLFLTQPQVSSMTRAFETSIGLDGEMFYVGKMGDTSVIVKRFGVSDFQQYRNGLLRLLELKCPELLVPIACSPDGLVFPFGRKIERSEVNLPNLLNIAKGLEYISLSTTHGRVQPSSIRVVDGKVALLCYPPLTCCTKSQEEFNWYDFMQDDVRAFGLTIACLYANVDDPLAYFMDSESREILVNANTLEPLLQLVPTEAMRELIRKMTLSTERNRPEISEVVKELERQAELP